MIINLVINFHVNIFLILIFAITLIKRVDTNYIIIRFKVIKDREKDKLNDFNDYFNFFEYLSFYGEISLGTPQRKILAKLSFDDYGVSVLNKGCDYDDIIEPYDLQNSSSSFVKLSNKTFYYKSFYDAFYAEDVLYVDKNNFKFKFIYSQNDNGKTSTCVNFGFKVYSQNLNEIPEINFINQLKSNNIISNYDWSILYDDDGKFESGIFLIGIKPHEYKPKYFNEKYIFNSGSFGDITIPYYNIRMSQIYFELNNNISEKVLIDDYDNLILVPTKGLIKATQDYEQKIEKYFFNKYIIQNKCYKEYKDKNNKKSDRTFVCNNENQLKEDMKKNFPILKFVQQNFVCTFELDYNDLFLEKGDKIYFLIYFFSNYQQSSWYIGYPFLKKYFFSYNFENKLVYFYNNDLYKEQNEENSTNNNNNKSIYLIILIVIICSIIAVGIGFLISKIINKKQKKKSSELSDYDSKSSLFENDD